MYYITNNMKESMIACSNMLVNGIRVFLKNIKIQQLGNYRMYSTFDFIT